MNNFPSYQKSKIIFGLLFGVVMFLVSSLGGFSFVQQSIVLQLMPVYNEAKNRALGVDNLLFLLQNLQASEIQNQTLKTQIVDLSTQLEAATASRNELNTIKQEHNIFSSDLPASILATVVRYSDSPNIAYIYVYTGDQAVQLNQFAVVSGFIVGQIVEVNSPYAKVRLVTSPDTQLNIKVGNNPSPAIMHGKSGLSLRISDIKIDTDIKVGDPLYLYQSTPLTDWGYKLGSVTQVTNLEVQGEKQLDAQSGLDLNNLKYVFIYRNVF